MVLLIVRHPSPSGLCAFLRIVTAHSTLFRGNTVFTKTMESCMLWYGRSFIDISVGSVIRRICLEKVAIEVDPLRSGKTPKEIERGVEQLIYWCREAWNSIYDAREECPKYVLFVFACVLGDG
jgi:hypothetical protein